MKRYGMEPSWYSTFGTVQAELPERMRGPTSYLDGKRRFFVVLHRHPITGPVEAVRAAIVAEAKAGQ